MPRQTDMGSGYLGINLGPAMNLLCSFPHRLWVGINVEFLRNFRITAFTQYFIVHPMYGPSFMSHPISCSVNNGSPLSRH